MMKRLIVLMAIGIIIVSFTSVAWAAKPIKLKAVQFVNIGNPGEKGFHALLNMINEDSKGELAIKVVGGPEAIPGRQQPEAVRTGAVDIAYVPAAWYKSIVPVAALINLSLLQAGEERKSGLYDFLVQAHKKGGLRYIGNAHAMGPFYLYAKKPIKSPQDLKGRRFRHAPTYMFYQSFGLIPVTAAGGEVYTGLERGLFEGLSMNHTQVLHYNLYEICKYVIGPGFWPRGSAAVIMNQGKFDGLPKHLQDVIVNAIEKAEPLIDDIQKEVMSGQWKTLQGHGVSHVQWSQEDSKYFLGKVNEAAWDKLAKGLTPDMIADIKKMMGY